MIDDLESSETRMRQALEALRGPARPNERPKEEAGSRPGRRDGGHGTGREHGSNGPQITPRGRHRFVRDGEVPVVHLAGRAPAAPGRPSEEAVAALDELRQRAAAAERAQREVTAQLQALQAKVAHTQMALDAANELAERRAAENEALRQQLEEAIPVPQPDGAADEAGEPRRRGRPPRQAAVSAEDDPEPVQWWLEPVPARRRR